MRRTVFVVPSGPAKPVSDDPDVHEHGVGPRWHAWFKAADSMDGRHPEKTPLGAIRVRLPRRLSATRRDPGWRERKARGNNVLLTAQGDLVIQQGGGRGSNFAREPYPRQPVVPISDVLGWLRGDPPHVVGTDMVFDAWEMCFPRQGLGRRPKPLPQRRPRQCPRCAEMDGWGCEEHQRPPLTLRALLQTRYELEARGPVARNPDGTVNVFLCPRSRAELFSDPEFQRHAMGFIQDSADGSMASAAGLRFFLRREPGWSIQPGQGS